MSASQLMFIKAEEDDKEVLKKRIKELENENQTLKQALEQLQQLQGKCCDWCEILMPSSDQERTTISNWLEGVVTALKSQKGESELIIDDDDDVEEEGIQNSLEATGSTLPLLQSSPLQPLSSQPSSSLPPPPPPPQPQSLGTLPDFKINPMISSAQPTIVRGTTTLKNLQIDYMKLKDIIISADERRGDKIKYLLNKMVDAIFTRDELVAASGLGIRTHKDKNHTPLDRKKLTAIKEFIEEFADKNGIEPMDPKTFRVTIGNKITNARRNLRNEFK